MAENLIENIKSNPKKYLKSLAINIVVILVSVAYVFYNMLRLDFQNLNPILLLVQSIVSIICGVVIKQSLGENGFSKGYNSNIWENEENLYDKACNSATQYIDRVDNFYIVEEMERRKKYRREHLQAVRLKYEMWFDIEGNYIGEKENFDKLTLRQKHMVNKCIKVKIYVLNLFSEYGTSSEQDTHKEITDRRQRASNITKNTVSAIVIAMIGVYFIPTLTMSWASLIASTVQVLLWVLFGILQLYKNYFYVIQDKVALLRKKKELIKKFTAGCEQGLYNTNPYDDLYEQHSHSQLTN